MKQATIAAPHRMLLWRTLAAATDELADNDADHDPSESVRVLCEGVASILYIARTTRHTSDSDDVITHGAALFDDAAALAACVFGKLIDDVALPNVGF